TALSGSTFCKPPALPEVTDSLVTYHVLSRLPACRKLRECLGVVVNCPCLQSRILYAQHEGVLTGASGRSGCGRVRISSSSWMTEQPARKRARAAKRGESCLSLQKTLWQWLG